MAFWNTASIAYIECKMTLRDRKDRFTWRDVVPLRERPADPQLRSPRSGCDRYPNLWMDLDGYRPEDAAED